MEKHHKKRICILVKAHPQRSKKYKETVCCAGITEDGYLIRLYPVPFRSLREDQMFDRFDWIEADMWKSTDHRPESFKVEPSSIQIIKKRSGNSATRAQIWLPLVEESFQALRDKNKDPDLKKSLGIIRPDEGSVRFKVRDLASADEDTQAETQALYEQQLLFEENTENLPKPEKAFE